MYHADPQEYDRVYWGDEAPDDSVWQRVSCAIERARVNAVFEGLVEGLNATSNDELAGRTPPDTQAQEDLARLGALMARRRALVARPYGYEESVADATATQEATEYRPRHAAVEVDSIPDTPAGLLAPAGPLGRLVVARLMPTLLFMTPLGPNGPTKPEY